MLSDNQQNFNSSSGQTLTKAPASKKSKQFYTKQATQPKDKKPTSYIMNHFRVNWHLYSYLVELVKKFNKPTKEFWFHIFACCSLPQNMKEGKWIPVPRKTINEEWNKKGDAHGKVDIDGLIQAGLLKRTPHYSIEKGICYCYKIPDDIQIECLDYYYSLHLEIKRQTFHNLMDGKVIKKPKSSVLYDENKNPLPDVIVKAIKGIEGTLYNHKEIDAYFKEAILGVKTKAQKLRLANDLRCYENIIYHTNWDSITEELAYYVPAYEPQKSGRITEKEGGLQSCSRPMKKAAFSFPNCHNYDLKSSQVYILKGWFEKADICTDFLKNYLANDKAEWAKEIGISVNCLKNCMYSKFMGAVSPMNFIYWDNIVGKYKQEFFNLSVTEYIWEYTRRQLESQNITDEDEINKLAETRLSNFINFVKPLDLQLQKFYKWLLFTYCKGNQKRGVVKNLTGMAFNLNEYQDDEGNYYKDKLSTLKRRITAFFLQGTEAAFIHTLSTKEMQTKYNYEVTSNQHDGLVTIGEVPKEAVQEAKEHFSIAYFDLVEKEICSKGEERWWQNT